MNSNQFLSKLFDCLFAETEEEMKATEGFVVSRAVRGVLDAADKVGKAAWEVTLTAQGVCALVGRVNRVTGDPKTITLFMSWAEKRMQSDLHAMRVGAASFREMTEKASVIQKRIEEGISVRQGQEAAIQALLTKRESLKNEQHLLEEQVALLRKEAQEGGLQEVPKPIPEPKKEVQVTVGDDSGLKVRLCDHLQKESHGRPFTKAEKRARRAQQGGQSSL